MARSQLEKERVAEFAMQLKKLFKQAYPEERSTSGILLQRFVLRLKTPISTQLLLRGKPDTFEKAIEAAREIELVLEFESKAMELHAKVSSVEDCDTGLKVALKELTERLGNMEAQLQSVVQCSVAAGSSKTKAETRVTEQEAGRRYASNDHWRKSGRTCCFRCGEEGHIKRYYIMSCGSVKAVRVRTSCGLQKNPKSVSQIREVPSTPSISQSIMTVLHTMMSHASFT